MTWRCTGRVILCAVLALPASAQHLSPEAEEIITRIAVDPRMKDRKDVERYARALPPTATLKQDLLAQGRLPDLNYIYGWSLSQDGKWPVERINDIVFEIVTSPRYDGRRFLKGLADGAPFLRTLRERNCLDAFNSRYDTAIPRTGGLPFAEAEKFLYSIVGAPRFDAGRVVSDLCPAVVPPVRAARSATPQPVVTAPEEAPVPSPRGFPTFLVIAAGIVPLAMIVLLMRSIARDLRARGSP